eukprot:CAMPEP_0180365492 /NCGR_PEP_ID=MMETSP0989-20121125/15408_1 /TAXON_ID=697907 /ORGANISM="non described non described, Strain CCMP2293" /LENGTH=246 /DNA_ID=CAMNT_0022358639 /DNA_START=35 /DNA_END=773 /DNA_ORIENTATION=-
MPAFKVTRVPSAVPDMVPQKSASPTRDRAPDLKEMRRNSLSPDRCSNRSFKRRVLDDKMRLEIAADGHEMHEIERAAKVFAANNNDPNDIGSTDNYSKTAQFLAPLWLVLDHASSMGDMSLKGSKSVWAAFTCATDGNPDEDDHAVKSVSRAVSNTSSGGVSDSNGGVGRTRSHHAEKLYGMMERRSRCQAELASQVQERSQKPPGAEPLEAACEAGSAEGGGVPHLGGWVPQLWETGWGETCASV